MAPLQIERQQSFKDLLVSDVGGPVVGGEDGGVEVVVEVGEPGGAFVVEVGEGSLLQTGSSLIVDGQEAGRERGDHVGLLTDPLGRVEPEWGFSSSSRAASPMASRCWHCSDVRASSGVLSGQGKGKVSKVVVGV